MNRYLEGGLQALLKENRGGRRHAYMTLDEEKNFLNEQLSSALSGEFVTINSLFEAYQAKVGRQKSIDLVSLAIIFVSIAIVMVQWMLIQEIPFSS